MLPERRAARQPARQELGEDAAAEGISTAALEVATAPEPRGAARAALIRVAPLVAKAARRAGRTTLTGTAWIAELVQDLAPRVPVRDLAALRSQHPGDSDEEITAEIVRSASLATGAVGAAVGGMAAAQILIPPTLLAAPLELVAETVVVAAIEIKLVAELFELHRHRPSGSGSERAAAYLGAWVTQRAGRAGFTGEVAVGSLLTNAGKAALRRRLTRRLGRNLTSLAPFLAGAVAGAESNRRATRTLAKKLLADLRP